MSLDMNNIDFNKIADKEIVNGREVYSKHVMLIGKNYEEVCVLRPNPSDYDILMKSIFEDGAIKANDETQELIAETNNHQVLLEVAKLLTNLNLEDVKLETFSSLLESDYEPFLEMMDDVVSLMNESTEIILLDLKDK